MAYSVEATDTTGPAKPEAPELEMSEGTPEPSLLELIPQALTKQSVSSGHPAVLGPLEMTGLVVPSFSLAPSPYHLGPLPCATTTFGHTPFPPPFLHGVEDAGPSPTGHAAHALRSALGTEPTGQLSGATELAVPLALVAETSTVVFHDPWLLLEAAEAVV